MPVVYFVAPYLAETTLRFVRAVAELPDITLAIVSQEPLESLPDDLRAKLAAHWRVDDAFDEESLSQAVVRLAEKLGRPARLLSILEQLQVPLGQVRDRLGITGMGAEAARNFRDKARMKTVLTQAGVPCARHRLVTGEPSAWQFVEEVGYPVVAKPPSGAGARDTFRVSRPEALEKVLSAERPNADHPMLLEEFITGEEHSFDTVTLKGRHVWHSLTRYYPAPLEVLENPWIQWCVLLPRENDAQRFGEIFRVAPLALDALGMDTGLSHMEWFRRRDGSVAISEVGARPPGAQFTTLMGYAHDRDMYLSWAELMVFDRFDPPERRYAAGAAFLRGQGTGQVTRISGLDRAQEELGSLVVAVRLPRYGQPPAGSYEGEGYVILRHPRTDVVEDGLKRLVSLVRVELG